jgi:hypothetical protein
MTPKANGCSMTGSGYNTLDRTERPFDGEPT